MRDYENGVGFGQRSVEGESKGVAQEYGIQALPLYPFSCSEKFVPDLTLIDTGWT